MSHAVCALVIHPVSGHILACTRRGTTDQWGIIGGKVDNDETVFGALLREFKEETDCEPLYDHSTPFFDMFDGEYHTFVYRLMFAGDVIAKYGDGSHHEIEPGIIVGFIPFPLLLEGPFAAFNAKMLDRYLAESSYL